MINYINLQFYFGVVTDLRSHIELDNGGPKVEGEPVCLLVQVYVKLPIFLESYQLRLRLEWEKLYDR